MLKPEFSGQFKKDYKPAVKRGCDPKKLEKVITLLCGEHPLPAAYRDHPLINSKNYKNMRECHIAPDWLLIYKIVKKVPVLQLIRTGTHGDLF
ncbi:type II toxin-antitoxin system YafQ family toxin [Treponema maltophilum]|uniref:type II toxin-antitoxin system YafQ family toxin n=1 Tax=Treponema maltophilum TaxID=51160 RepID=UPI003D8E4A7E